jgi:hypothetical protein
MLMKYSDWFLVKKTFFLLHMLSLTVYLIFRLSHVAEDVNIHQQKPRVKDMPTLLKDVYQVHMQLVQGRLISFLRLFLYSINYTFCGQGICVLLFTFWHSDVFIISVFHSM